MIRVAGFGHRAAATADTLRDLLTQAEAAAGGPVSALSSLPAKAAPGEPLHALAAERGLPLLGVAVAGIATPSQSARVLARLGTGSLAEAAALAAAGPGARLMLGRITSADGMATCAIALAARGTTRGHHPAKTEATRKAPHP